MVVGLGGPSGVGKSSLADRLALPGSLCLACGGCGDNCCCCSGGVGGQGGSEKRARIKVIHGDHYFLAQGPPPPYDERPNMETPSSMDFERLMRDLEIEINGAASELRGSTDCVCESDAGGEGGETRGAGVGWAGCVVVIESFLLLAHEPLVRRLDAIFVLVADVGTCLNRRLMRNPSREASEAQHLEKYFRTHVWPSYQAYTLVPLQAMQAAATALRLAGGDSPACGSGSCVTSDARLHVVDTAELSRDETYHKLVGLLHAFVCG